VKPIDILRQFWGFDNFRPLQEDIIQSALDGKDTLALLPTGGGKSLCFQVPAMCKEGICLVISPLIALMKDQVFHLRQKNIPAEAIFSGMRYQDIDRILDNCVYGDTKLLYISPERLKTELFLERLKKMNVNLIAIDEAHCISQWGYDFRPAYLEIALIRELLPEVPLIALTATATPKVVEDIQQKLNFKKENVFQKSFVRDNLAYVVLHENQKEKKLLEILTNVKGSGVVYVRSRRRTKDVALLLQQKGIAADFYHGGLPGDERSKKQEAWIRNENRIMVCTNAFGMGIDKSDVRSVVHLDVPDSPEAYFQEAGRGGRDGKKAFSVMLYKKEDGESLQHFFNQSFPPIKTIKQVYQALGSFFQLATGGGAGQSFDFDIVDFCKKFNLKAIPTYSSLKILAQSGWLVLSESIFLPSSLTIKVSKEKLYDYQLKNKDLDTLIKAILRSTEGAFHHFVSINENNIALFLKLDYNLLIANLHKLHKEGIIIYNPKKDSPQIIFLEDRVTIANLTIDQKLYEFRKNRQQERVKKMISYAEDVVCRQRQLLEYFGEDNSNNCTICDVCLGRNKTEISKEDYLRYKEKIKKLLEEDAMSLENLVQAFAPKHQKKVLVVMETLADEGFVENVEGLLKWNDK
jgi:ATP-dependent DNA helicase RecQ